MNNKNKAIARIEDLKSIWNIESTSFWHIKVGDVLFTDGTISQNVETEIAANKTPIAICVAPASEFDDHKARFVSLRFMTNSNNVGSTEASNLIWGAYGVDAGIAMLDSEASAKEDKNGETNTLVLSTLGSSYQAANVCRAFSPGVYDTEWYLPALGELYYVYSNYDVISNILSRINAISNHLIADIYSTYVWSSSLFSSYSAWYLYLYLNDLFGYCNLNNKDSGYSVLAFVAISDTEELIVTREGEALEAVENLSTATAAALTDLQFKIDMLQSRIDNLQNQIDNL